MGCARDAGEKKKGAIQRLVVGSCLKPGVGIAGAVNAERGAREDTSLIVLRDAPVQIRPIPILAHPPLQALQTCHLYHLHQVHLDTRTL